jgi:hypothetical protein
VRRAVIVLTVLLALLGAAGCSGSAGSRSNRTQCVNGVCQVSLSGEQTIELEIGSFERDLRVGPIEPNAVTLSVRDDQARLAPGESAQLGGLQIRVKSVSPPATELRSCAPDPGSATSRPTPVRTPPPPPRPGRRRDRAGWSRSASRRPRG